MPDRKKARALTWSKEVERRARDYYRRLYPGVERAARAGREDKRNHPDLVGLPIHVQVKARATSTVNKLWTEADSYRLQHGSGRVTHLVTQAKSRPVLVTMRLDDYISEIEKLRDKDA